VEPPRGARTVVMLELDGDDSDFFVMTVMMMMMSMG
jgi:hypothetical protein